MIFITQGHENSIGIEVLLKSISLLDSNRQREFSLVCFEESVQRTQDSMSLISRCDGLNYIYLTDVNKSQSYSCLDYCLENISDKDILITLPTSKDQLPQTGHTDFFRNYYGMRHIAMSFYTDREKTLLITDHVPLSKVCQEISAQLIFDKVEMALQSYQSLGEPIEEVYFAGINPHAGEQGLLGSEEERVRSAKNRLEKLFPEVLFTGPLAGDSMHIHHGPMSSQLMVYMYHDQALTKFKSENGFLGLNMTLGLPFLRISVDHGTAFDLYSKDCSNYMGMYYALNKAIELKSRIQ